MHLSTATLAECAPSSRGSVRVEVRALQKRISLLEKNPSVAPSWLDLKSSDSARVVFLLKNPVTLHDQPYWGTVMTFDLHSNPTTGLAIFPDGDSLEMPLIDIIPNQERAAASGWVDDPASCLDSSLDSSLEDHLLAAKDRVQVAHLEERARLTDRLARAKAALRALEGEPPLQTTPLLQATPDLTNHQFNSTYSGTSGSGSAGSAQQLHPDMLSPATTSADGQSALTGYSAPTSESSESSVSSESSEPFQPTTPHSIQGDRKRKRKRDAMVSEDHSKKVAGMVSLLYKCLELDSAPKTLGRAYGLPGTDTMQTLKNKIVKELGDVIAPYPGQSGWDKARRYFAGTDPDRFSAVASAINKAIDVRKYWR
ncbi:hypothetical protein B484DRAFT_473168 [Ochromonadaceae sp. CCMP2298]|nr:hypothetical protein B484DRAFT_473168 [Ochromonadaceae sp. CCMP2298]